MHTIILPYRSTAGLTSSGIWKLAGRLLAGLWVVMLAGVCSPRLVHAQPRFSGYYEHTLQVDKREGTDEVLGHVSKLRLDIEAGGAEDELLFRGNVNVLYYHRPLSVDLAPYLPEPVLTQLQTLGIDPELPVDPSGVELNNAWLAWTPLDVLRIRAGRQQLSWGPGYAYNPTDLFHDKTLIDPAYEKRGVSALRTDLRWGVANQLTAVWAPGDRFNRSGYALRGATHLRAIGYDVALTAHAILDTSSLTDASLQRREQDRYALGGDFAGSIFGLGVWAEGNWNWMEREDDFLRLVAGVDYTLPGGWYVQAEAFYNGRGEEEAPYSPRAWLGNLLFGEPVGRGWVMAGGSKDFGLLTQAMLYGFVAADGSLLINPRLRLSIARNADLVLFAGISAGERDGMFPQGLVSGVARAYVYF